MASDGSNICWTRSQKREPLAGTTAKEIECYRKKLRAGIPNMTEREVRRHRVPYHEAMLLEMQEDGFQDSAEQIRYFLETNVKMREAVGDETLLKGQPRLQDQHLYLDKLRNGLSEAQRAREAGDLGEEGKAFLQLATFFMSRADYLWWIAEDLFQQCVRVSRNFQADGGRFEATLKYIYGRYLLQQRNNPEAALPLFQQARTAAVGKNWSAEKQLGEPQDTIFVETCCLLVKALLRIAEDIRSEEPRKAIRMCNQAIRRAFEAGHSELGIEAFLQLGASQMEDGSHEAAVKSFGVFLGSSESAREPADLCNAHLNLAICYKKLGNNEATLNHLLLFKSTAEEAQLTKETSSADRFIGEYYLTTGQNDRALSHLLSSFSMCHRQGMMEDQEETRALAAIAMAQDFMPSLIENILLNNQRGLKALLRWKNVHTPLHTPEQEASESEHSIMYAFMHARSTSELKLATQQLSKEEAVFKQDSFGK